MGFRESEQRTLWDEFPELIQHLYKGANVLDIGCGPGTITLNVADVVVPGTVTGVDLNEERNTRAIEIQTERGTKNATFQSADAHSLPFNNDTFDVICSYTSAHFWLDPIRVLRELRRVAKPRAWVITAGIRDFGFPPRYPIYPAWEAAWTALIRFMEARYERYVAENVEPRGYWDFHAARKCIQWYAKAGFTEPHVSLHVEDWLYPGSLDMESNFTDFMLFRHPVIQKYIEEAIADGFMDKQLAIEGRNEALRWVKNPHSFHFHTLLTIKGRA